MARVRHRIGIVGDINKIYRSMHEPAGLCGWWATTIDGTPKVGEVLDLHFSNVVTLSFRIQTLEEDALIRLHGVSGPGAWRDCLLEFSFNQDPEQVWVKLVHENKSASDDDFLYFNTKWTCYLLSLRDLIERGKGNPYPNDVKIHFGD